MAFGDLRGTAVTRLALADCGEAGIATIIEHSLKDVGAILNTHYLSRDSRLAESAMEKRKLYEGSTKTPNKASDCPKLFGSHSRETPYLYWQGLRDSNPRPSVLETDALPTELNPYADDLRSPVFQKDQENLHGLSRFYRALRGHFPADAR